MEIRNQDPPSSAFEPAVATDEPSKIKMKLGELRRRVKNIDLREKIVSHPFASVGIGLAAGAVIGLVRPVRAKPEPGRVTSALMATLGAVAFRLVREAAVRQLGVFAKDYIAKRREGSDDGNAKPVGAY